MSKSKSCALTRYAIKTYHLCPSRQSAFDKNERCASRGDAGAGLEVGISEFCGPVCELWIDPEGSAGEERIETADKTSSYRYNQWVPYR
jgi:hypothetical protein